MSIPKKQELTNLFESEENTKQYLLEKRYFIPLNHVLYVKDG
jgi:hypothetical protein